MRITTESLLKIAADAVDDRTQSNRQITAAYLHGSLLGEAPLLGETTDIDLTFIYQRGFAPPQERELVRISSDIHLDILHHDEKEYKPPRSLRTRPWLGSAVYDFKPIYDPKHFLDFVQAGVRSTFFEPEVVLERAMFFYRSAREIWMNNAGNLSSDAVFSAAQFLYAVENAGNALVSLNGPPLTLRRFAADLPEKLAGYQNGGLYAGFMGLSGLNQAADVDLDEWLKAWHEVYPQAAALEENAHTAPVFRLSYYRNAVQAYIDQNQPAPAVWIILQTWLSSVQALSKQGNKSAGESLIGALNSLGFCPERMSDRWTGLDLFLDKIEELFENWKLSKGI